jgi:integrase
MLTARKVETIKPGPKAREYPDGHVTGLYLAVHPSGKKSWYLRYRAAGRPSKLTLGPYPVLGLAQARERAIMALGQVVVGGDPAGEKRLARKCGPPWAVLDRVGPIAEGFILRHVPTLSPRWRREVTRMLRADVVPSWDGRRLADIGRADVIELLDRIADRGSGIAANRTLAVLKKLGSWSVERGLIATSPFTAIRAPSVEQSRDRVLDDDELRAVWLAAEGLGGPFGPIVQLLILLGQRRGEISGLRWAELDFAAHVLSLPKERTKNGRAHVVPLPKMAIEILEKLPRIENTADLVFTASGKGPVSGFSTAKARLDKLLPAGTPRWCLHDLRRSFASGCARLGTALHVTERLLNHVSGSFAGVTGTYQRHSFAGEKRSAMEAWAKHIERIVSGEAVDDNVVRLADARQ